MQAPEGNVLQSVEARKRGGTEGDSPSRRNPSPKKGKKKRKKNAGTKLAFVRSLARWWRKAGKDFSKSSSTLSRCDSWLKCRESLPPPSSSLPRKKEETRARAAARGKGGGREPRPRKRRRAESPRRKRKGGWGGGTRSGPLTLNRTVRRF